jgi:DNA uptake protein ComE-like DNA-binding protein
MRRVSAVLVASRAVGRWLGARTAGLAARAAGLAAQAARLAAALAYRPPELMVIGLMALGVLGGLGVEAWRQRAPGVIERLETEPPRFLPPGSPSRPRSTPQPRHPRPPVAAERRRAPPRDAPPAHAVPVDLNRAVADDLVRLPGIGARTAAKILAHRQARGGRFEAVSDLLAIPGIGAGKVAALDALIRVTPAPATGADQRDPLDPWEPTP